MHARTQPEEDQFRSIFKGSPTRFSSYSENTGNGVICMFWHQVRDVLKTFTDTSNLSFVSFGISPQVLLSAPGFHSLALQNLCFQPLYVSRPDMTTVTGQLGV
jgi:hypothetical protein